MVESALSRAESLLRDCDFSIASTDFSESCQDFSEQSDVIGGNVSYRSNPEEEEDNDDLSSCGSTEKSVIGWGLDDLGPGSDDYSDDDSVDTTESQAIQRLSQISIEAEALLQIEMKRLRQQREQMEMFVNPKKLVVSEQTGTCAKVSSPAEKATQSHCGAPEKTKIKPPTDD